MTRAAIATILALAASACSAPATLSELALADQRADAGDVDGAVAAYRAAQLKCGKLEPRRRATQACSDALLGEGEVLERNGRKDAAIQVYLAVPGKTEDAVTASTATYRAGELLLRPAAIYRHRSSQPHLR